MENILEAKKDTEWKAWIDESENKLHVHGEIYVQDKSLVYELGRKEQGYLPQELLLEITPKLAPGNERVSIKYHEALQSTNPYSNVVISSGAEEVASLKIKA